jgi:hypothetical protein
VLISGIGARPGPRKGPAPILISLIAVVLVVLAAACGGSRAQKGPPQTKASFAAAANQVCRQATTHRARIAGLRKLRPPIVEQDLYLHLLNAERLAVDAEKRPGHPSKEGGEDPLVQLAIAHGKIAGYARRLGADACVKAPAVTMPS